MRANEDLYANVTTNFNYPREKLEIMNELGQGAFGRVLFAKATDIMGIPGEQDVAVKTLKGRIIVGEPLYPTPFASRFSTTLYAFTMLTFRDFRC